MSGGTFSSTPRPTAAYAPMPTASARMSRNSSAPRRRRCTKPMRVPVWLISAASSSTGVESARPGVHGLPRVVEVSASMPSRTWLGVEVGQPVELDVGDLVGLGEVEAGQVGVDAAEDGDDAVVLADVVLAAGSTTTPAAQQRPRPGRDHGGRQQPAQPAVAARRARARSGRPRGRCGSAGDGDGTSRDVGRDRLDLAGVAGAVAAEQARRSRRPRLRRRQLGGGADEQRRRRRSVGALLGHVGDDAGDVVGAAGLEAGADELDGGVVGRAGGRGCRPSGRRSSDAAGAVAAEQEPVARRRVGESKRSGSLVADAVERLEDQVAVRVGPRLAPR